MPDGNSTAIDYGVGFGSDRSGSTQFRTTGTDGNGKQKESLRDVRDFITSVQEFNQGETLGPVTPMTRSRRSRLLMPLVPRARAGRWN